ncbi:MAG: FAD-binding protein [Anaerolineales bacterium]
MNIPEATQNISELQSELAAALEGEVLFDAYSRALYSTDASNFSMPPLGVVLPRHPDEINAIVEIGAKYGVPLIPRGSGTSMAGQALGHGLIVDFTRHLNQILNVDQEAFNKGNWLCVTRYGQEQSQTNFAHCPQILLQVSLSQ